VRGSTVTLDARGCKHFIAQDTIDKGIGVLDVTRTTNNEVEYSKRYFLTTFAYDQIDSFMKGVREHWNIEIGLHWSLDVSFREDLNQVRIGYAAKNLATVRRIALNLLKQEINIKKGISCKRKKAGWDHAYLLRLLQPEDCRLL
jgi:predicted transposase YbfD/YdcC